MTRPRRQTVRRPTATGRRPAAGRGGGGRPAVDVTVSDGGLLPAAERRWLAAVIRRAATVIGRTPATVSVRLLDDAGIAELHGRWLGKPNPTDVITFDLADAGTSGLEGDIAISVDTARRAARQAGWAARHELAYYAVHGLLHLAGEDDRTAPQRRKMRARERDVMAAAGLPTPPQPRRNAGRRRG